VAGFAAWSLLCSASAAQAAYPSANWVQVNQDGFVAGQTASNSGSDLLVFASRLYAHNEYGLFRMDDPVTRTWTQVNLPAQPGGPGTTPAEMLVVGNYLYAWDSDTLWWIASGADLTGANWTAVTSTGLPGGVAPRPRALFNGNLYGVYNPTGTGPFEIWRSGNVGAGSATWTRVVQNSFGDPTNNHDVDIMIVFNNHIYAGTTTLTGIFGSPIGYGTGVEIWESASGDSGAWSQVNTDGFGTWFINPPCYDPVTPLCTFPIHQVIGSGVVYQPPGAPQEYLYIGTKSHFGAEVWRYDGSGLSGWTNVTPPWAGHCVIGCGPGRDEAMVVYQNTLFLGEGFPTGNLGTYDGTTWAVEVLGPNPFGAGNAGVVSLVVFEGRLYAGTLHAAGGSQGDQVWRYTYSPATVTATKVIPASAGHNFGVGSVVTYSVVLSNSGAYAQLDNPGDEFSDTLPPQLTLVGATATSGAVTTVGNTVHWNGTIPSAGSVTITITATINAGSEGTTVANQGSVSTDLDGDGSNETNSLSDDPRVSGSSDPTTLRVAEKIPVGSLGGLVLLALALLVGGWWLLWGYQVRHS